MFYAEIQVTTGMEFFFKRPVVIAYFKARIIGFPLGQTK